MPQTLIIAFLIHKRYIPDPEQLNQQRFKCAAQMRETLYYDPTQDLPPGIHASIYRPEPEIEDDPDPDEPELSDNWQPSDDPLHF